MNEVLNIIASLWPIGIGIITLIIVLARMHYNLRSSDRESKSSVRLSQQKKQIILCQKEKEHTEVKWVVLPQRE